MGVLSFCSFAFSIAFSDCASPTAAERHAAPIARMVLALIQPSLSLRIVVRGYHRGGIVPGGPAVGDTELRGQERRESPEFLRQQCVHGSVDDLTDQFAAVHPGERRAQDEE